MTSMSRQMFVLPSELAEWLAAAEADGARVYLDVGHEPLARRDGRPSTLAERTLAFVTPAPSVDARLTRPARGQGGLVSVALPRQLGRTLYLTAVGVKTEWLDPTTGELVDRRDGLELLRAPWRTWRRSLHHGRLALRHLEGGTSTAARGIYTSAGAERWAAAGGSLRQDGVPNVVYELGR